MYVFECTSTWNIGNRMLCLFFRNIHPSGKIVKLDKKGLRDILVGIPLLE